MLFSKELISANIFKQTKLHEPGTESSDRQKLKYHPSSSTEFVLWNILILCLEGNSALFPLHMTDAHSSFLF